MLDFFKSARSPSPDSSNWTTRLRGGLAKTRERLGRRLGHLLKGGKLDAQDIEALEEELLAADVGVAATQVLLTDLNARWKKSGGVGEPYEMLRESLRVLLRPLEGPLVIGSARPWVIMLTGVNGAGKTTSIGKLAKHLQGQGRSVLLAAGDTFRAAAREQLVVWGERNGVAVVAQEGGDPAAVMFDAIRAAQNRDIDVVLADTAGRLPTQLHLMEELKKVQRVIAKAMPGAPHETLLVLDANTGQNALAQVRAFDQALGLSGLVLTKLDGSAKGGVVAAIAQAHPIPLRLIGVGEGIDDLQAFGVDEFVEALLPRQS